ncbi:DUF4145 domain-containing protein [Aureivirga sp. CE67]|uniref:DUF4145 domain-containing protein n=1 Tax=Aureivirga sp. CE67 TaxID=1788983 RepID=UPI0018C9D944|nr:DUF4145 domain-containing protein [Aureivirga sp. CE67]
MKNQIWKKGSFLKKEDLIISCPKCQKSNLKLEKFKNFITENGNQLEKHGYPYGIEHLFLGILKCLNESCKEIVSISGFVEKDIENIEIDHNNEYQQNCFDYFTPNYFYPNIKYFKLNEQIPENIRNVINLAFHHYFYDLNACANKIRTSIELILDDIKAPKKKRNKNGELKKINNLHNRIEHFSKKNKTLAIHMLANKYIGNDGSHINNVKREDVLLALDNLEEIINIIYIKKNQNLISKSKKLINSRENN